MISYEKLSIDNVWLRRNCFSAIPRQRLFLSILKWIQTISLTSIISFLIKLQAKGRQLYLKENSDRDVNFAWFLKTLFTRSSPENGFFQKVQEDGFNLEKSEKILKKV